MTASNTSMTHADWTQPALRQIFRQALLADARRWLTTKKGQETVAPYALIDAGQLHLTEVDLDALLQKLGLSFEPILRHTPEAQLESVGPYLIDLGNANEGALEAIVGLMEYGWTVCFLSSRLPDFKLHTHLRGCLNGLLESGDSVQLRYYDPRVMASLLTIAPQIMRTALLAPLDTLALWDRELGWQITEGKNSQQFQSEHACFALPDTLISALGRAGEPDLILSLIVTEDIRQGELDALAPHLQYQIVNDLIRRARQHGLTTQGSIRLFASIGLRTHPLFDEALPHVAQALATKDNVAGSFMCAVATSADSDWVLAHTAGQQHLAAQRSRFASLLGPGASGLAR